VINLLLDTQIIMHIGEISFCNRLGFNVKSDEFKKQILDSISGYGSSKIIQKHHEKFVPETSISIINANPHMMTLRTNGNPYYMYMTTYNGVNQCIFIDKKVQQGYMYPRMVIVKFWLDDALFQNTLFTGEMVKSEKSGEWTYVIHDIIADSGQEMNTVNLVKRINRMYEIFSQLWTPDARQDVCDIKIKRYFHLSEYSAMMDFSKTLPYSCRGIYFKPLFIKFKDILYNFDDTLVKKIDKGSFSKEFQETKVEVAETVISEEKTKVITNPIATMMIQKSAQPDIYQVFTSTGIDAGIAFVNNIKTSKMLRERFDMATPVDKVKFHCIFNTRFSKWGPIEEVK